MKKIAIIGGSYLQLPLVKKAKEMGLETHCFAWAEGAVCRDVADFFYPISIIEKDVILAECKKIDIDAVVTIASDLAVLTVNYIAQQLHLIGNDDRYSCDMTNKYAMRNCFLRAGLPSPAFARVTSENGTIPEMTYPVIVKPTDRSGSRGVEKVEECKALQSAVKRALNESFAKEVVVEEFIKGREISVESISWQGKHYILAFTDKVTTEEPYFVELEHHQPAQLSDETRETVGEIVKDALDALHISYGASHAELKIQENGQPVLIEVGARMGGDFIGSNLVQLSTGYDFLQGVVEIALGEFKPPVISNLKHSGVYFLSKESEYVLPYIQRQSNYSEIVAAKITNPILRSIDCSVDRSGYFIYQADDKFEIIKNV